MALEISRRLYRHHGDLSWWPGDTPLEVSVGAILTKNTAWANVEKAIRQLKASRALGVRALHRMSHKRLGELIRAAGYFNVMARRLKNFISFLQKRYGGCLAKMFKGEPSRLREKLLSVNGIGPETADSIPLYADGKPIFVIDAYTKRIHLKNSSTCQRDRYSSQMVRGGNVI